MYNMAIWRERERERERESVCGGGGGGGYYSNCLFDYLSLQDFIVMMLRYFVLYIVYIVYYVKVVGQTFIYTMSCGYS